MIPNGYWMMDQIPEEWQDKVRFSAFPENRLISSPETFGWAIVSSYSQEVKEGAAALLKLRTQMNMEQREELFEQSPDSLTQAERDYIETYKSGPVLVPNYPGRNGTPSCRRRRWEPSSLIWPGKISPEEFTRKEDESIQEFLEEQ